MDCCTSSQLSDCLPRRADTVPLNWFSVTAVLNVFHFLLSTHCVLWFLILSHTEVPPPKAVSYRWRIDEYCKKRLLYVTEFWVWLYAFLLINYCDLKNQRTPHQFHTHWQSVEKSSVRQVACFTPLSCLKNYVKADLNLKPVWADSILCQTFPMTSVSVIEVLNWFFRCWTKNEQEQPIFFRWNLEFEIVGWQKTNLDVKIPTLHCYCNTRICIFIQVVHGL